MKYGILLCVTLLLLSCSGHYYEESFDISPSGWVYEDAKVFRFKSVDNLALYDIVLDITHDDNYGYENLYILISTTFPDDSVVEDQVSIPFISESGTWQGKPSGEDRRLRAYLQQRVKLEQLGEYTIAISQHSRDKELKGIQQVCLALLPVS